MRKRQWSRSCSQKKRRKRKLCLDGLYFLYLFCAFLCPREIGVLSVSALERMTGTTRLELATSAVQAVPTLPAFFLGTTARPMPLAHYAFPLAACVSIECHANC